MEGFEKAFIQCSKGGGFRERASEISRKNAMKFSKQQFANRIEDVYYSLLPHECKAAIPGDIIR
jgi:hypothetical protein